MPMTVIRKIRYSYGILLMIALASAVLSFGTSQLSNYHLKRSTLAHQSYEAYLGLSVHIARLFETFEDSLMWDTELAENAYAPFVASVDADFDRIRSLVAQKVDMDDTDRTAETAILTKLETQIRKYTAEYKKIIAEDAPDQAAIIEALENEAESEIEVNIQTAITYAVRDVIDSHENSLRIATSTQWLAIALAALAGLCVMLSFVFVSRELIKPLRSIVRGAKEIAQGNYAHRTIVTPIGELQEVAQTINLAAHFASERQKNLQNDKFLLELQVQEQTAELRRTILSLEEQKKTRQQMLTDVSHELRTPLTIIKGETDIALRGGEKPSHVYREALRKAGEAAKHTSQLVNDMLFIGRQESGVARLDLTEEDLVPLLAQSIDTMRAMIDQNHVVISFEPQVADARVFMDVNRMRQVIMILIENACYYGGKHVRVRVLASAGGALFSVADDGPGIALKDQEQIFERFFRGSNSAERYDKGTGLGLPVAQSIVVSHNGRIDVKSTPGNGAEFFVFLPTKTDLKAVS